MQPKIESSSVGDKHKVALIQAIILKDHAPTPEATKKLEVAKTTQIT